tara:strand:- start:199 stop:642 length:444 start_codon:yes stop_codon:yes gene_type:complete
MKQLIMEVLALQHEKGIDLSKKEDRLEVARLIVIQLKCTKRREMANMSIIMRPYTLMVDKLNALITVLCQILVNDKLTVKEVSEKLKATVEYIKNQQMELADDWYNVAMDKVPWDKKRETLLEGHGINIREMVEKVELDLKKEKKKK